MKKIIKFVTTFALAGCVFVWALILSYNGTVASNYYVDKNSKGISSGFAKLCSSDFVNAGKNLNAVRQTKSSLKLFGIFPIKEVTVTSSERKNVVPGGIPFGVKLISNGVMITATTSVRENGKYVSPAKDKGITAGDTIIKINSENMTSNEQVINAINKSGGNKINVTVRHQNKVVETYSVSPVFDVSSKSYKIGVVVKDSTAGIGTITYYEPETETFGGLGHAVCEGNSGNEISLLKGNVVMAEIDSVTKGQNGTAGQLNGHFASHQSCGTVLVNDKTGVYGSLKNVSFNLGTVEVAYKQEVKLGKATVITTVSGMTPKEYEIEIEKISYNEDREIKNMVICVTDKNLISKTGGIVQGMSGSPILQGGKLVGAVTHVFVNDSTRGYAIFAENMLETAGTLANKGEIKDAS